jgi:hypothetical protein
VRMGEGGGLVGDEQLRRFGRRVRGLTGERPAPSPIQQPILRVGRIEQLAG